MSVFIKAIPTLTGESAEKFIEKYKENTKNKGSIDFSKEYANSKAILEKRKL